MRFKLFTKPQPEIGVTRVKSKFLLFPKMINHEIRWLEYTTWIEEFTIIGNCEISGDIYGWHPKQWND